MPKGPGPGPRIKTPRALLGQPLTERERQAARLIHEGRTVDGVALSMGISHKTARNHLSAAYAKTGVRSQAEFVLWVERGGLQRDGIETEPTPAAELLGPPYLGSDVRLRQDGSSVLADAHGSIALVDAQPNDLLRITWKGKRLTLWVVAVEDVPVDGVAGLRAESVLVDDLPPTPSSKEIGADDARALGELVSTPVSESEATERICRVCGCTESRACDLGDRGCSWVEDPRGWGDLCSACLPYLDKRYGTRERA